MNRRVFGLFAVFFLTAACAQAKMVYYYDEKGDVHYVNTDYVQVPEQYMRQVLPQLAEPSPAEDKDKKTPEISPTPTAVPTPADLKPEVTIEFFTSVECKICNQIELLMRARKLKFNSYDVNYHPRGRQFLSERGGQVSLPVVFVNGVEVEGTNINAISDAVEKAQNAK